MKTIVHETRDANGFLSAYSMGYETQGDLSSLQATRDDVAKYAGKTAMSPAELFFHRFGLLVPR